MTEKRKENIKNIFILSIPIIIENILQTLLGTTDTYFAGQIDDLAIVGIGVTNIIMNVLISFFTAITVGSIAVIARSFGHRDYEKVNRSIIHSILLGIVLGVVIGAICAIFREPILLISGADYSILPYAMPYYLIVSVPCVFLCLELILSSCLRAIKDTKLPMYIIGGTNILKIALTALFVRLDMGVFGLGLATTLSRVIGMAILFLVLYHHDKNINLKPCHPTKQEFKVILRVGIPAGVEKLIMRIGQLIYNAMVIHLGTIAYVAHNIAGNIETFSYTPAMGFGLAVCTLVGVSLGENDIKQAKEEVTLSYLICAGIMALLGVGMFVFARPLAAIFTDTVEVQDQVVRVLRLIAVVQPFSALVQVMTNALQGAGDTEFPMYVTFLGVWGLRTGMGFLFAVVLDFGLIGAWSAYSLDLIVRGLLLLHRFRKGHWQHIRL